MDLTSTMNSPYLEAIQKIPGLTPGEKYKTLNEKARAIVASTTNEIDPLDSINSFDIPEPLVPIVRVEISKILRKPDGIIEALKSEDSLVFDRALQAKWFFDGTNEITNAHYYNNNIFPHVSLNNRIKIIKNLAAHLSSHPEKSAIAEEFFEFLCKNYGEKLAEPLLIACSESFLRKMIIKERRIDPNGRSIKIMYQKYPMLIIDFLKLSKSEEKPYERRLHEISIYNYVHFLPQLVKNNVNNFIELIELHKNSFNIKFSRKRSELFMKNGIDVIVRNPNLFLPMMSLKQVTDKLTAGQYKLMFSNLFPPKIDDFTPNIMKYLEFYPESEKIDILLSTFKEVYGKSLLEVVDGLTPEIFRLLPVDERIRQARKRLEKNDDWYLNEIWNLEKSWRCYLPTNESIPMIKKEIGKNSNGLCRMVLLQQMIFTCWINSDLDALLETLKYLMTRHKNEQGTILLDVMARFLADFGDITLTVEHWEAVNNLIQWLFIKNDYYHHSSTFRDLIIKGIHFNLTNKLPISDKMDVFIEVNANVYGVEWNIIEDHPEYERTCLVYVLERIPQKYSEKNKIGLNDWDEIVTSLIESINHFNKRNLENPKTNLENVQLSDYQWLVEDIKKILNDNEEPKGMKFKLARALKKADAEIYESCVLEEDKPTDFNANKAVILLKNEPQKIKDDWEKYLNGCCDNIYYGAAQRFIRVCRWHQDLPIKFAEKAIDNFTNEKEGRSLIVLALLYEGSSFERFIVPFLPTNSTGDIAGDEAKMSYMIESALINSFKVVEPPISLDLFFDFCQDDRLHMALATLVNLARRAPVRKVIQLAMKFMDQPVSMKKQGIRMFYLVSTMDEIRRLSVDLLRNEKHRSNRTIVFDKIMQLFVKEPNEETWGLVQEAFVDLKPDDDALESFVKSDKVANEFISDYLRHLLETIRRLEKMEEGLSESTASTQCNIVLHAAVDASKYLSEEFHEYLLQEFFSNLDITNQLLSDGIRRYVVYGYLIPADEKFERRLQHVMNLLKEIIEKHWNIMDPERPGCLPGNYMLHEFIEYIVKRTEYDTTMRKIMEAVYKTVFTILKPQQMPTSYLYLTYAGLIRSTTTSKEFGGRICEVLPSIVEALSEAFVSMMANILHELLSSILHRDDMILDVVETLLESKNDCSAILASMLLFYSSTVMSDGRFWKMAEILKEHKHPAVVSNIYMCINRLPVVDKKKLKLKY